jgi:hypothetical protein
MSETIKSNLINEIQKQTGITDINNTSDLDYYTPDFNSTTEIQIVDNTLTHIKTCINPVLLNFGNHQTVQTHSYDAQLKEVIEKYRPLLKKVEVLEIDIKKNMFESFLNEINNLDYDQEFKNYSIQSIKNIINDIGKSPNYDGTNDLKAEDVLYLILAKLKTLRKKEKEDVIFDHMSNIIIQLSDMVTSGPCPQGRCTRLWQLFNMMYN